MSVEAMTWAFRQRGLDPLDKFVLVVLADGADEKGLAMPSLRTIAKATAMMEAEVSESLKRLLEYGLIERSDQSSFLDGPFMKIKMEENKE